MFTRVKTPAELAAMRESGAMLAAVLRHLRSLVVPSISGSELAAAAGRELKALGGEPAFKGYRGFPDVICLSVNDAVVHGIPDDTQLQAGDIIGMDFGVRLRGMITDGAITVPVGEVPAERAQLISATSAALEAGIAAVRGGVTTGDIAATVQAVLQLHGYGIVRELAGHGVGHHLHEDPDILNYGRPGSGPRLTAGMTIAIEPMATLGSPAIYLDSDQWTIRTRSGQASAHFEHTILITDDGAEILTF